MGKWCGMGGGWAVFDRTRRDVMDELMVGGMVGGCYDELGLWTGARV